MSYLEVLVTTLPVKNLKIFISVSTTQKSQGWVFDKIMKNSPKFSKETIHQLQQYVSIAWLGFENGFYALLMGSDPQKLIQSQK